jgi:acetyl-CoA carboxylase biotin carboxyl carrier protein
VASKKSKVPAPTAGGEGKAPKDLAFLEWIADLMSRQGLAEISWETKGAKFSLKTPAAFASTGVPVTYSAPVASAPAAVAAASVESPQPVTPPSAGGLAANQKQIVSPFVGTFYRSPSPTAESYVREGQSVKQGDVLCLVEAMKLMNEIEADFSGKIVSILVENGQPVEFGEPLFIIQTS